MPKRLFLLAILILALLLSCAKRNTAYQDDDVLTLLRQIPVVGNPLDLDFDSNNIYVAQDQGGISIINRTNYAHRWLTALSDVDGAAVQLYKIRKVGVVGEHKRMFLNETDGTDLIPIVDLTDPDTLKVIDAITGATQDIQDLKVTPIPNPTDADIIELIYCAGRNVHYGKYNGDIWLGSSFSIYPPASASGIDLSSDHVFIAAQQRGLMIYSRLDQQLVSEIALPGEALKVMVSGNYAYVASRQGGLNVVDISNPALPVLVDNFDTVGYATSIDIKDNLAVLSSGGGGVYLFDISTPTDIKLAQRLSEAGYTNNARFVGDKLVVAARDEGILIYDVD